MNSVNIIPLRHITHIKKLRMTQTTHTEIRKASCKECLFLIQIDDGYSNWTVEGTTNHCLFDKNPGMPEDNFYGYGKNFYGYGENNALRFVCKWFDHFADPNLPKNIAPDKHIRMDVDRDQGDMINYTTSKQLKALLELNPSAVKRIMSWKPQQ